LSTPTDPLHIVLGYKLNKLLICFADDDMPFGIVVVQRTHPLQNQPALSSFVASGFCEFLGKGEEFFDIGDKCSWLDVGACRARAVLLGLLLAGVILSTCTVS
jgi:hypothetical protein